MMWLLAAAAVGWYLLRGKPSAAPSASLPDVPPTGACQVTRRDGPLSICLNRDDVGQWSAKVGDRELAADQATIEDALGMAWLDLKDTVELPVYVVPKDVTRHGVTLRRDGTVSVQNNAMWNNFAAPIIQQQQQAGEDAAGTILAVLIKAFGQDWNPLRWQSNGDFWAAVNRFTTAGPATPHVLAQSILG